MLKNSEGNITGKVKFLQSSTIKQVLTTFSISLLLSIMHTNVVYAGGGALDPSAGTAQFDAVISFLATWVGRIGGVVIFLGILQFAFALHNQNPDGKINGFLVIATGAMLMGIAVGYRFFIGS